ncbi:MAG: TonB-dependent receptor [Candidatus Didemnitutus sp.]|nr:TonB-dependent receptor [Candidatus Didemnitutus sp.]
MPLVASRFVRFTACLTLLALSSLVTLSPGFAQSRPAVDASALQPGSIEGSLRIKDSSKPAAGVVVTIRESGQTATTDEAGRYTFQSVMPGTYTLVAEGEGYGRTRITDVVVRPGSDISLSRQVIAKRGANYEPIELEEYVVSARKEGVLELDPLDVRGRREKPFSTGNLDLTRTRDDVLPFTTFSARDIELSGTADLQEFLQHRLPQNFNSTVFDESDGAGTTQTALTGQVDLRGWGATETVFLLNGRRMPAHYQGITGDTANATPNLSGIPLGSIERIEILSSAGSAIYGVSATGGVINIITRQDFKGGQLSVNYETPSDVHAPKRGVNLSYGLPLKWGWSLRLGASFSDSKPLRAGDRADVSIERWRRRVMEIEPSRLINQVSGNPFLTSTTTPVYGATPNIRATTNTGNLFSAIPGAQSSNYTTVPTGATVGSPLSAYQPGVWNIELAEGAAGNSLYAKGSTLGTANSSRVLSLGVDKKFGEHWRWSLDASHTQTESEGRMSGELRFIGTDPLSDRPLVPANAPTNPFNQPVRVNLVDPNMDRPELRNRPRNDSWNLSSTLRGAIGEWRGFFDLSYAQNQHRYSNNYFLEPDGGWTAAFLSGAYNPFVDPRVSAFAAPDFYEHYVATRIIVASATRTYRSALKASGPLLSLPAGVLQLTAGVEGSRTDRYRAESFSQYQDGLTGQPRTPVGATSEVANPQDTRPDLRYIFDSYAGYAEATVPLLSSVQGVPLVQRLELFGSGRLDRLVRNSFRSQTVAQQQAGIPPEPLKYTTTSHLSAFGLRYEPVDGVAFRATQSIGFRPPSISQITPAASPPTATTTGLSDPLRTNWGGVLTPSMYVTGGNPDLKPETTDSTNLGLIFTPRWVPGLRVSVDYLESVRNDAIFTLSAQEAINLESELPGVVQRGAPDGHPSGVGPITFVDRRNINLRQIASKSVDFSVEQRLANIGGGRLVLTAAATRNLSFKVQTTNTGAAVEQVRNPTGAFSRQIAWNGNAQLRWEGPQWSVGWSTRYFDYILANPTFFLLQGSDRAPRALNHDLNVNYRVPVVQNSRGIQGLLSGSSISFGVKNVFDRAPRFWANSFDRGIAPYDSIMGRSVWLRISRDL